MSELEREREQIILFFANKGYAFFFCQRRILRCTRVDPGASLRRIFGRECGRIFCVTNKKCGSKWQGLKPPIYLDFDIDITMTIALSFRKQVGGGRANAMQEMVRRVGREQWENRLMWLSELVSCLIGIGNVSHVRVGGQWSKPVKQNQGIPDFTSY